jgi:hypothetical protein
MDENLIAELMAKYARHEVLSAEESRVLEEWLAESDEHRALVELFQDEKWVEAMQRRMRPERSVEVWESITRRLDEAGIGLVPPARQRRVVRLRPVMGAAAAMLAVGVGLFLFFHRQRLPSSVATGPAVAGPNYTDSSAAIGPVFSGPRLLRLPDNSVVWLDTNARVRVARKRPGPAIRHYGTG